MPDLLPEALGAAVETVFVYARADILAPFAGAITTAVARYLLDRQDAARGILRDEFERAGATAEDFRSSDQLAAAALRYSRAARDQAADENLRLLAQAMIGLARRHELWASDFLKYAEILAPLSRDELILLGCMMATDAEFFSTPLPPNSDGAFWSTVKERFVGVFPDENYLNAIAARAQRSGLVLPIAGLDGTQYVLSPIGREVREFVNIEAACGLRARPDSAGA